MTRFTSPSRATGDKESQLSNVALLYYGEGMTQGEIAKRMKVSRATIVNMLRESRELGIVDIRVDGRILTGSRLARNLRDRFGVEDVYVSQTSAFGENVSRNESFGQLARVAAAAILDVVETGDTVGVAWGETIMAVANAMPRSPVADVEVCQLVGSMISERVPASENCAIQIAGRLDAAACYTLHAPGLISTAALAETFRNEIHQGAAQAAPGIGSDRVLNRKRCFGHPSGGGRNRNRRGVAGSPGGWRSWYHLLSLHWGRRTGSCNASA